MTDKQTTHPSPQELAAFGLGDLDEQTAAALEAHLADCPLCCEALENLKADTFVARLRETTACSAETLPPPPSASRPAFHSPPGGTAIPPELANHPRYRVLELLGRGGMGVVYKAEHLLMERPVALKVISHALTDDPGAVERFRREVKGAARLAHPNIVAAYDAEQAGGLHFLVMEYVEGVSLDRVVAEKGCLPVTLACDYARQAALGLQHAFERGMVHRDVKPQNLMLMPNGQIKILDFGLARFAQETVGRVSNPSARTDRLETRPTAPIDPNALTLTGAVMGTPDYIAPEQINDAHTADVRSDVYSLGCTLYHLLAGQVPFPHGSTLDKLLAHHERRPRPLGELRQDLPAGLIQVVERMMDPNPNRRYQTPAEVAQALAAYTTPEGARLPPAPEEVESPRPPWWDRLRKALLTCVFVGGPVALFLFLLRTRPHDPLEDGMEILYLTCAIVGGALLLCQFLLGLLGLGHGHDVGGGHDGYDTGVHDAVHDSHADHGHEAEHEAQSSWFTGVLTFRTVVAGLTFFGLAGRAAVAAQASPSESFLWALVAGAAVLFGVAWLMRSMYRLKAEGTVRVQRAVGQTGTVYVSIPGGRAGAGKVHLNLQNRTAEYQAVTAAAALPTGTRVTVVAVVSPDTVEVIPATASERVSHV
jgi:serine/threonine protein kinase